MSKTVSTDSASAAELETPHSLDEAMETGFLPDDEHYRLTGEFKPEKTEAAAASSKEKQSENDGASAATKEKDESETSDASAASSSKAAASETAQSQSTEEKKENRWQKRERELRELKAENARLKAKPQTEVRSETAQPTQAATETKAAAKTPKPKIDDQDPKTGKAKYASYAEYEDAKDNWLRQDTIREFQETSAKSARETAEQQQFRERGAALNKKFEAPRAKYADFDQVALSEDLTIPAGSVAELFIHDSDHAGEVLYYLGQHPDVLKGFYRDYDPKTGKFTSLLTPQRQFRALMEIEANFSAKAGAAASDSSSSSSSSSVKTVTQASPPPHQVSGKGTVSKDAVEQALDDGDFETYQRTQNAKELARLKRK